MYENTGIPRELPYIPCGPFKLRFPFIHYRVEKVEFIQGLILGVTALSSIPYLMEYLGLPYELAWSCVIFEVLLYTMHAFLGDAVIPGWITPSIPLTIIYLQDYTIGPDRIKAMIALQLLLGLVFLFLGASKLSDRFVRLVPDAIKGGILLAAPISVLTGQLSEGGNFEKYPVSILAGVILLLVISFSSWYQRIRKKSIILDIMAKYGNLFPYLLAMVTGLIVGELEKPAVTFTSLIKLPDFGMIIRNVSIFSVGFPEYSYFIKALPLALICYVIAFGDFITSETLLKEAKEQRKDEYVEVNSGRTNIICGIRNILLALIAPFPPLAGPLWVGMAVSVSVRYREGKEAMKSLLGGMASFRLATFISVICIPVVMIFRPLFPVGASITLLFQAFVCARIGMEYLKDDKERMIGGVMAVILTIKGCAWALLAGFVLYFLMSDMEFIKEKNLRGKENYEIQKDI